MKAQLWSSFCRIYSPCCQLWMWSLIAASTILSTVSLVYFQVSSQMCFGQQCFFAAFQISSSRNWYCFPMRSDTFLPVTNYVSFRNWSSVLSNFHLTQKDACPSRPAGFPGRGSKLKAKGTIPGGGLDKKIRLIGKRRPHSVKVKVYSGMVPAQASKRFVSVRCRSHCFDSPSSHCHCPG